MANFLVYPGVRTSWLPALAISKRPVAGPRKSVPIFCVSIIISHYLAFPRFQIRLNGDHMLECIV